MGARYHPAMIAQAWATLERMFPGRAFLGIGSGEALNEVPVGDEWPSPKWTRSRAWTRRWTGKYRPPCGKGETTTGDGRFYKRTRDLKLHTLLGAAAADLGVWAFGPQAAEVACRRGDGLWTLPDPGVDAPEVDRCLARPRWR